jgi:hypothetical protein
MLCNRFFHFPRVECFPSHFPCCSVFWSSNLKGPMFFFLYLREYLVLPSQGVTNQDVLIFITQVGAFELVNHAPLLSFNQLISFFFLGNLTHTPSWLRNQLETNPKV